MRYDQKKHYLNQCVMVNRFWFVLMLHKYFIQNVQTLSLNPIIEKANYGTNRFYFADSNF